MITYFGMDLRSAYEQYRKAMVRVTVESPDGNITNGAGFHVGSGLLATARHVVEGNKIVSITSECDHHRYDGVVASVHFPGDANTDLVILRTNLLPSEFIPLGFHLDDWVSGFVLSRVLVMGYPRVPFWQEVGLLAVLGNVTAESDRYDAQHPHFVLSLMARSGFSGGPAISEYGFLLGVVTQSLIDGPRDVELGFPVAVTIEPLLQILREMGFRPPGLEGSDFDWYFNKQ